MKRMTFKIDVYDWNVNYLEVEKKDEWEAAQRSLRKMKAEKCDEEEFIGQIKDGNIDGGWHIYNTGTRRSLMLILPHSNIERKIDTIFHEARHLVDMVLEYTKVKDVEASAYLSGYIAKKLYKVIK